MGDSTGIEWTDATWNPIVGCKAVSPGCDNCYAAREAGGRLSGNVVYRGLTRPTEHGPEFTGEVRLLHDRLDQPRHWKRPRRIFVNSMSDLFHPAVTDDFRAAVFDVMHDTPQHTYQVLTKRPQEMAKWTRRYYDCDHGGGPATECRYCAPFPNIWLGTSIESNRYAFRANHLRQTTAAVRFLSLEPLLGDLHDLELDGIDWVIVGGESGPRARPMHPDWARDIRDRCRSLGIPFLFKQWGEWLDRGEPDWAAGVTTDDRHHLLMIATPGTTSATMMERVGKHQAGRELDGRLHDEYPPAEALTR